jgi:hypothetical protein
MVQSKHFKVCKAAKIRAWGQIDAIKPKSLKIRCIFTVEKMAREVVIAFI